MARRAIHALAPYENSPATVASGEPGQEIGPHMSPSIGGDGDKVVEFPKTAEERRALRKAKQDLERQRLIAVFVDEAGTDQALFRTGDGTAYADLIIAGHRETWPIRSKQFRFEYVRYLKRQLEHLTDKGAVMALALGPSLKKAAVNAAIDEFEMRAICSQVEREVHVRVASDGGDIYIDLCDRDWRAVRVTAAGWSVVQSPPVRFRREPGMQPLPFPEHGTSINALRPFLNINENDFVLVVAFLLAALQPHGPYPVFVLIGEQGTSKTTLVRILRSLVDPGAVPTSSLPFSGRDLFIAAHNSHIQAFENVSRLSNLMSDYLCRLATGGGMRTRALFKNADETLFRIARPIMLEGIANFVTRADLLDRAIMFAAEPLSSRRSERSLYSELERLRPGIFGALLDRLVIGIKQLPHTHLANAPRMVDFATWAVACGLDEFEKAYAANRQAAIDVILEHDVLARAVQALVKSEWAGTATELLDLLGPTIKITNPKVLSDELGRLAPMLRTVGLDIKHQRTADRRGIRIVRQ
jgi:hypothetical protein